MKLIFLLMFNVLNYVGGGEKLFLDDYPNAWGYAMQKIKGNYSGPVVELRRSTDNDLQNFYFDSNNKLSLTSQTSGGVSLSSWVGSNSAYLRTWYNQNTTGENWQQTLSANQPRVVNSGVIETLNGEPAFFNVSGNYMTINTDWLANKRANIFGVYDFSFVNVLNVWFSRQTGNFYQFTFPTAITNTYTNSSFSGTMPVTKIMAIVGMGARESSTYSIFNSLQLLTSKITSTNPAGNSTFWLNRYPGGTLWNVNAPQNFMLIFNEYRSDFLEIQTQINELYSIY